MYNQPDLAKRQSQSADARQKLPETFRSCTVWDAAQPAKGDATAKATGS